MNAHALKLALVFCVSSAQAAVTPPDSASPQLDVPTALHAGKAVYDQHCAACHGISGDGHGPAAVWLFPKPRDFSAGMFKIQSTPPGAMPSDDDLLETITRGMPGSSMPSFTYLSERDRRDSVDYIKFLTAYTDESGQRINHFDMAEAAGPAVEAIPVPPEPFVTLQALTQGKEIFVRLQCATCHGETGAADGPSAPTLKDNFGLPLPPRDFNTEAFRGGHTGRDLYLRIANGMAGTPMPPFTDEVMTPEERWDLVLYIQSLRRKDVEISEMLAPPDGRIHVNRHSRKLPTDPADADWDAIPLVRVPLNPLWPEPQQAPALALRAVHDGRRIAFLVQWRDPTFNGAPVRTEDFQDAVALQFSLNGSTPFLGMGDADNPVNIWQWKAAWQEEIDGPRPDVNLRYASMHVDLYPESRVLYQTAEAAGNLLAQSSRTSPVEDSVARGFGTLQSQSAQEQNVAGRGIWRDEHWQVVLVRDLKSRDAEDVQFAAGKPVPVAFAVWDGDFRDRNGRKIVSNWYQLILE